MESFNIVGILGVGLSGFGFLLMYLAYRLIDRLIGEPSPQDAILRLIRLYIVVCFVMTITVGVFTYINAVFKNKELVAQAKVIDKQQNDVDALHTIYTKDNIVDSVIKSPQTPQSIAALQKQEEVLDTLGAVIKKYDDPVAIQRFDEYRVAMQQASESLKTTKDKQKLDSFKAIYIKYNKSINDLSLKHVKASKLDKPLLTP